MKNKKLKIALSIGGIIAISLSTVSVLLISNVMNNKYDLPLQSEVVEQQKIKITSIKYSSISYGSQKIFYSVNPKLNTDEIDYSMKYVDSSEVEDDIFSISFKPESNYIDITCLKPFTKQVVLTIYAKSNDKVNASINIDFKEKISLTPELEVAENTPLTVNDNLITTGGSITFDKTIQNKSITFSSSFVSTLKTKLKERFETIYYSNPQTTTYTQLSAKFVGLDQEDCDNLFTNNFTFGNFLESIYYEVEFKWIESDSDYESEEHVYLYVSELLKEDFYAIFDGQNPVFSYSFVVNNQTYNEELGFLIDSININSISINQLDIVF